MFEKRIVHHGLNAYRLVRASSESEVNMKAHLQEALWAERWQKKLKADQARENRAKHLQQRILSAEQTSAAKALALEQTRELEDARESLQNLLHDALERDARLNWEAKKDRSGFSVPKPSKPKPDPIPTEPDANASRFNPAPSLPTFNLLDKFIRSRRGAKLQPPTL